MQVLYYNKKKRETCNQNFSVILFAKSIIGNIAATQGNIVSFIISAIEY